MIFSHVLYQLSYLGIRIGRGWPLKKRARSLTVVGIAVHPCGIGGWTGDAIAFTKPFQEVAVAAAAAAERRVLGRFRLAA